MTESWRRRIDRADELAAHADAAAPLLMFYAQLLRVQRDLYESLQGERSWCASGSFERDLQVLRPQIGQLLDVMSRYGPDALAAEARLLRHHQEDGSIDAMLLDGWRTPSDRRFLPKAVVQPYAHWLATAGIQPIGRSTTRAENRCPFCGGLPQLAILHTTSEPLADGGGRALFCANCLTGWPFRRVVCASCGEESERQLAYYRSPGFDHVRVDACESCGRYLKTIDLTRLGLAVPIVDEVASATLDVWASERGYQKLELNLVGL
jgi:FdhE protein